LQGALLARFIGSAGSMSAAGSKELDWDFSVGFFGCFSDYFFLGILDL